MRARDTRAIAFCVVTIVVVCLGVGFGSNNWLAAAVVTMVRVFQRLRGDSIESKWQSYFSE
jgi:small basic protein